MASIRSPYKSERQEGKFPFLDPLLLVNVQFLRPNH